MPELRTKEQFLSLIRAFAEKTKRNPTWADLRRTPGFIEARFYTQFRGLAEALAAAGLEARGGGFKVSPSHLLLDWAAVVRKLNAIPTFRQYRDHGRYSMVPFRERFGGWLQMPRAFRHFVRQHGLQSQWSDVLRLVAAPALRATPAAQSLALTLGARPSLRSLRCKLRLDRPIYGSPLPLPGLAHEPVNEAGVIFLFGVLAHRLGFIVQRFQTGFPDCEALYEVGPGKWQRLRIEIEFASRNFAQHRHRKDGCDLIVCWIHNWPECPANLEVIELRKIVRAL